MQRVVSGIVLVVVATAAGGCIIAIGNTGSGPSGPADCRSVGNDSGAIAEIDAAAKLFSDSDKTKVYKGIAGRPNLSGRVQTHLVKTSMKSIFSDASKEEVLLTLIENPCFNDVGKRAVLANLNSLFSDSRKTRVLAAINRREMESSPIQVETTVEVSAQTEIK